MKVLKEILQELILIRKELQAIRRRMEFKPKLSIDGKAISEALVIKFKKSWHPAEAQSPDKADKIVHVIRIC